MFETTEQTLSLCGTFASAGFILAVLYNIFRFPRLAFPKRRVMGAVLDVTFALIAGLTLFIMSVEYGTGFFRLYYVAAAAFGFAANMLTLGWAVPPIAKFFSRLCGALGRFIAKAAGVAVKPVCAIFTKAASKFAVIRKNMREIAENNKIRLQSYRQKVYNKSNRKIGEEYGKGGERGNVIKAKVRKIV